MKKKSTNDIIDSAKRVLSFAVLRRSIRTRETEENAMLKKEGVIFNIVEFRPLSHWIKRIGRKK
jgi:hypothetical protein